MKTRSNRKFVVNQNVGTTMKRVRDFMRMNPPKFCNFKYEKYPQEFVDKVYKVLSIMGVTSVEKMELAAYQLKGFSHILFNWWKEARPVETGLIEYKWFESAFLERFFPLEMREAKSLEFINFKQGKISVWEYSLSLNHLSMYAPFIVADRRAKISMFVSGVSDMVVKKCHIAMLIHDMDISLLMAHTQ